MDLRENASDATRLLRVLANESRLAILCLLAEGERSVGDITKALGKRQATVSQQLAILREEKIVTTRRDAQTIYYSLADEAAQKVIEVLHDIYCAPSPKRAM